jgi:GH25 family lysozyme M1 (1,4-beta-N-acetylmuramidase)
MTIWGFDVSDYQGVFDMQAAKNAGFDFTIIKATEGNNWKSKYFAGNLQRARDADLLVSAYHYQRGSHSAQSQADNIASMVPKDVGIIPDVEANGGNLDLTDAIMSRCVAAGYRHPLSYIPKWYWQSIGSPSMKSRKQLWQSHYPDNVGGTPQQIYLRVPSSYWTPFGEQEIKILQFSSASTVAGRKPIDANAFRGSLAELATLFGGQSAASNVTPTANEAGVEIMKTITVTPPNADQNTVRVFLSGSPGAAIVVRPRIGGDGFSKPMWVGDIFAWGSDHNGIGHNPTQTPGYNNRLTSHRRYDLPGGVWADVNYSAAEPFEIDIVG